MSKKWAIWIKYSTVVKVMLYSNVGIFINRIHALENHVERYLCYVMKIFMDKIIRQKGLFVTTAVN